MGAALSAADTSTVVERKSIKDSWRVGVAEMNGWRKSMEDAHVIHLQDNWAFFGVFDGHGGDQCSAFVAREFKSRLREKGCPADDQALKDVVLEIDRMFLDEDIASGTTGAMCIAHKPDTPGGKIRLRVANVGDSRVFLGHPDGTIFDGPGTEQGLSTDHKPNNPSETERINRCGGKVEIAQGGVARVNGDLAVSRAFGDKEHKKTGGPGLEDRPVTANPEFGEFECDESDFLIIACDGVSEGDFPNPEVVKFIADSLKTLDVGEAARQTIFEAEKRNSKDNITCMIIQFSGASETVEESIEYVPGPITMKHEELKAYEAMAQRGGKTLAEAIEMRYDLIADPEAPDRLKTEFEKIFGESCRVGAPGAPPTEKGDTRTQWFDDWVQTERAKVGTANSGINNSLIQSIMASQLMQRNAQPDPDPIGKVRCCEDKEKLVAAVDAHPALKWDPIIEKFLGEEGELLKEDTSDDTMQVKFSVTNYSAWLPKEVLTVIETYETKRGESTDKGYAGGDPTSPAVADAA